MSTPLSSAPCVRRLVRRAVAIAGFLAVPFAVGTGALAPHSNGITGFSGKQGFDCTVCHSGGVAPTVALAGPDYVLHDSTRTYSFTVSGGQQVAAGLDIAVGRGKLVATDAPSTLGKMRIWATGNSVNLDGSTTGDAPGSTILQIEVVASLVRFTEYGSGLAGSGGFVPHFTGTDGPAIAPWSATIADALGGATCFVFVGEASGTLPLFGGTLWLDLSLPWTLFPVTLGGASGVPGAGSLTINGDDVSALAPFTYFAQCLVADPATPHGFAFSNALEIDIEK